MNTGVNNDNYLRVLSLFSSKNLKRAVAAALSATPDMALYRARWEEVGVNYQLLQTWRYRARGRRRV